MIATEDTLISPKFAKILDRRLREGKGIHSTFRDEQGREFAFNYHVDRHGDFSVTAYGAGLRLVREGEWFVDDSHIQDVLTYHQFLMDRPNYTFSVLKWLMACFEAAKQLRGLRKAPAMKRKG